MRAYNEEHKKWVDFLVYIDSRVQNWVNKGLDFKIWVLPYIMCIWFLICGWIINKTYTL